MLQLFHVILYQPIFNIFVFLYNVLPGHDVGVVILVITAAIRLILYPLTTSSIKAQKSMQELQPKLEEVKKKFAADKQQQTLAIMELYKQHRVNPFTSCLPMLLQVPVLIALYLVLRDGLASSNLAQNLYPFITNPGRINQISLGWFDLSKGSAPLALLAGLAQFWQAKMLTRTKPPAGAGAGAKDEGMAAMMNKQMLYLMPAMTFFIGLKLPAGLTLYWFLSTLLMGAQQWWMFRSPATPAPPTTPTPPSPVVEGKVVG